MNQNKLFISGAFWSFFGQFGYMLVGLVGNVLLARMLSPSEFGQVGIVMFFVLLANVLVESGFGGALIRLKEVKEEDYFTVFIFNFIVSLLLFVLLLIFSGLIANYYSDSELRYILIALSSILILNSFQITQNARLVRNMEFKKRAVYKLIALFLATIIAITLAYFGYGVWAIVSLQVFTSFFLTLLFLFFEKRIKKHAFSKESFKNMYSFGVNTTLTSILNTVFENIYQLILGKYFSIAQVGFFYQAKRLQEVPDSLFKVVILNVIYSYLSKIQDDKSKFIKIYTKIALFVAVIVGFTSSLVVLYSKQLILLLYGNKWASSAFFLQLLAIASFFYLQEIVNRNIFKVYDQTKKILHLEIVKKLLQTITIFIGIYFLNLTYLICGYVLTAIISYAINYYYSRKIINAVSYAEIKSILIVVFTALACVVLLLLVEFYWGISEFYMLLFLPLYSILYYFSLKATNTINLNKEFRYLYKQINKK